jgi:hypothetical protein
MRKGEIVVDPEHSTHKINDSSIVGTWRLVSFDAEDQATGERWPTFGKAPKGRLMLMPDGYMMVVLTAEGRQPATTDADRAKAFKSMFAYSGKYKFDGDSFITDVDVASLVEWTGAQQVRTCRLVGSRLQFISKWAPSPFDPSRTTRGIIEFERDA